MINDLRIVAAVRSHRTHLPFGGADHRLDQHAVVVHLELVELVVGRVLGLQIAFIVGEAVVLGDAPGPVLVGQPVLRQKLLPVDDARRVEHAAEVARDIDLVQRLDEQVAFPLAIDTGRNRAAGQTVPTAAVLVEQPADQDSLRNTWIVQVAIEQVLQLFTQVEDLVGGVELATLHSGDTRG